MNISLTPELEQYVKSARSKAASITRRAKSIREGLRLLKEKDDVHQSKLEDLRREIQIGIDQASRGEVSTFNKATLNEIKAEGRKRLRADRKSKTRHGSDYVFRG